jgi:hypothetical protein
VANNSGAQSIEALINKLPARSNDNLVEIDIGRNVGDLDLDAITIVDTLSRDISGKFLYMG